MSKSNPRKAMAALLPPGGAVIRPMTLGVYAALERIGSPLVTGENVRDTLDLIPSLYLLTHDPREVFRGNVLDLAMQWADTKPVEVISEIRRAAEMQMEAFYDVVPQADEKKSAGERRMDRLVRRLGGKDVRMGFRRDNVGGSGQRDCAAPSPGMETRRRRDGRIPSF